MLFLLLFLLLKLKIVKEEFVEDFCNFILKYMILFFIPAFVGIMVYLDIVSKNIWAILLTVFLSTAIVIIFVGVFVENLIKYQDWFRQADDKFDQHLDSTYIASNVYRQPAGVGTIGNWLTKFEEENGFKHVTCHGLRHTYCSLLLTQNVPIQTVSRYMGHSDSTITLEVYSHFIPDTQERALTALDNITG